MLLSMAEADENHASVSLRQQLFAGFVKDNEWLATFLASDFHVLPPELRADAGAEGLGDCLLGGETRR